MITEPGKVADLLDHIARLPPGEAS
jgi:hypothetical protein